MSASRNERERSEDAPRGASKSRSGSPKRKSVSPAPNKGDCLYVSNLPSSARTKEIQKLFEKHAEVADFNLCKDVDTGDCRGYGFIRFNNPQDAEKCLQMLDGTEVNGRKMKVEFAKRSRGYPKSPGTYLGKNSTKRPFRRSRSGSGGRRRGGGRDFRGGRDDRREGRGDRGDRGGRGDRGDRGDRDRGDRRDRDSRRDSGRGGDDGWGRRDSGRDRGGDDRRGNGRSRSRSDSRRRDRRPPRGDRRDKKGSRSRSGSGRRN